MRYGCFEINVVLYKKIDNFPFFFTEFQMDLTLLVDVAKNKKDSVHRNSSVEFLY